MSERMVEVRKLENNPLTHQPLTSEEWAAIAAAKANGAIRVYFSLTQPPLFSTCAAEGCRIGQALKEYLSIPIEAFLHAPYFTLPVGEYNPDDEVQNEELENWRRRQRHKR